MFFVAEMVEENFSRKPLYYVKTMLSSLKPRWVFPGPSIPLDLHPWTKAWPLMEVGIGWSNLAGVIAVLVVLLGLVWSFFELKKWH